MPAIVLRRHNWQTLCLSILRVKQKYLPAIKALERQLHRAGKIDRKTTRRSQEDAAPFKQSERKSACVTHSQSILLYGGRRSLTQSPRPDDLITTKQQPKKNSLIR